MKVRNMTRCALAGALIALCAWISVPSPVPFTLQTFAVFLTLGLLGGKAGSKAIGIYLALGLAGLPVFSGFQGGAGVLLGPTGGYLVGFLAAGVIYLLCEKWNVPSLPAMTLGMLGCYGVGTVWFMALYAGADSVGPVLMSCVVPFLIPDGIKIWLAWLLARRLKPYV